MLLWVIATLGVLLSLAALVWIRRVSRRLGTLNQSYWELRYDYTRLRSQMSRLDPEQAEATTAPLPAAAPSPSVSFVPLSSIRKKPS